MYDHVTIRVSDRGASERFYRTVLETIGVRLTQQGDEFSEWDDFSIAQATGERPVTRHLHVGFVSPSREQVDEFWRVGTEAGYESDGEPGPRTQYSDDYYGSFLLDPDGNSVEAVHHEDLRRGNVDHLWLGVADLQASIAFYSTISRHVGIRGGEASDERMPFRGAWGTFSLLADGRPPTENLHLAFPVPGREDVQRYHEAAVAAGYRDNGAPRERPGYHPGYYGAFVLDPDGNNVEAVFHGVQAESHAT
jgi:catechol 2,3-dioxygenase-like lactoylglutathione lyase family enzyme